VQIESWGAFAEGKNGFFTNPTLVGIADAHDKSVAQIALRWTIQRGVVVIPKSVRKERVTQNLDVFDFTLSDDEMSRIVGLDLGTSMFFDHRDSRAGRRPELAAARNESGRKSDLIGRHDPQLADRRPAGPSDHVSDTVRDVFGGEHLSLVVEGVDHLGTDVGLVVRAQFGVDASWLDDADAHMPLGDFLPQGLGESVHGELGEVVDAVAVPCDAAGDRADVDDVGDTARTLLGGLK